MLLSAGTRLVISLDMLWAKLCAVDILVSLHPFAMPFRQRIKELFGSCFREPTTGEDLQAPQPLPQPLPDVGKDDGVCSPRPAFTTENTHHPSTGCPHTDLYIPFSAITTYVKPINILPTLHLAPLTLITLLVLSNLIAVSAFDLAFERDLGVVASANSLSERNEPARELHRKPQVRKHHTVGPPWSCPFFPVHPLPPFGDPFVPGFPNPFPGFAGHTHFPEPVITVHTSQIITSIPTTSVGGQFTTALSPQPLTNTSQSVTSDASTSTISDTDTSGSPASASGASPVFGVSSTSAFASSVVPYTSSSSTAAPSTNSDSSTIFNSNTASSSTTDSSSSSASSAITSVTTPVPANTSTSSVSTTNPSAPAQTSDVVQVGNQWLVPGVGTFDNRSLFTFDQGFPDGLQISNYSNHQRGSGPSPEIPYNPTFDPANVQIVNGMLALTVPGDQNPNNSTGWEVSSAEITTAESSILYGSVRTKAILSPVPGTCHGQRLQLLKKSEVVVLMLVGFFFYQSDTQETDIEYLTDPSSLSNNGPGNPIPVWYTNQAVNPEDEAATQATGPAPSDCTTAVHEYRLDWTSDYTAFYLDGKFQMKFTTNVPSEPGPWVWNNWSNGNKGEELAISKFVSTQADPLIQAGQSGLPPATTFS